MFGAYGQRTKAAERPTEIGKVVNEPQGRRQPISGGILGNRRIEGLQSNRAHHLSPISKHQFRTSVLMSPSGEIENENPLNEGVSLF